MIIRRTTPDDGAVLLRLAALDSQRPLGPDALVAVVDGDVRAAVSLDDGRVVADPFRPTAELVELLVMRAAQLADAPAVRRRRLSGRMLHRRGATADA